MKETKELIIDPEFASQIPPLDPEEYEQLEENILKDGELLSPIVTWNGIIVDGYNRYKIIRDHPERNIRYQVCEKEFPDRYSVLVWICKNQLGQRNLSDEQKRALLGREYKSEKNMHAGGQIGNNNAEKRLGQFEPIVFDKDDNVESTKSTAQRVAKDHGVSESTVKRAGKYVDGIDLAEEAVPGTRQDILSGKIKPTNEEMSKILKAKDPKERKELIAKLYEKKPASHSSSKKKKGGEEKSGESNELEKTSSTHANLQDAKTILEDMAQSDGKASENDVIYELRDALDTLMYRWSSCIEMNPEATSGKSYQKRRNELIEKGIKFLCDFKTS